MANERDLSNVVDTTESTRAEKNSCESVFYPEDGRSISPSADLADKSVQVNNFECVERRFFKKDTGLVTS